MPSWRCWKSSKETAKSNEINSKCFWLLISRLTFVITDVWFFHGTDPLGPGWLSQVDLEGRAFYRTPPTYERTVGPQTERMLAKPQSDTLRDF